MKILGLNYMVPGFLMTLFVNAPGFATAENCWADHIDIYHGQELVQTYEQTDNHHLDYCKGINVEVVLNDDCDAEQVKFVALQRDIIGENRDDFTEFFAHTESLARWFMFGNSGDTIGRSNLAPSRDYLIKIYAKVAGEFELTGTFQIPSAPDCLETPEPAPSPVAAPPLNLGERQGYCRTDNDCQDDLLCAGVWSSQLGEIGWSTWPDEESFYFDQDGTPNVKCVDIGLFGWSVLEDGCWKSVAVRDPIVC